MATAESCTGGLVAGAISAISGSSAVLDRGFVTYSNHAKQQMLGVKPDTLDFYGAVSPQCAEEMVKGALAHAGVDLAVSITGIAGPTGGSPTNRSAWSISPPPRAAADCSRTKAAMAISDARRCAVSRCCRRWRC